MKNINWGEIIGGIIISIVGALLINKSQSIASMCLLLGGYHIGKNFMKKIRR